LSRVIACDKREAFAQGSASDEAIHPLCCEMNCFALLAMKKKKAGAATSCVGSLSF
jgi:hypothetical protein